MAAGTGSKPRAHSKDYEDMTQQLWGIVRQLEEPDGSFKPESTVRIVCGSHKEAQARRSRLNYARSVIRRENSGLPMQLEELSFSIKDNIIIARMLTYHFILSGGKTLTAIEFADLARKVAYEMGTMGYDERKAYEQLHNINSPLKPDSAAGAPITEAEFRARERSLGRSVVPDINEPLFLPIKPDPKE